jgi:integrase
VALKTALKWGLLPRNPADAVTPGKPRNREMQTWGESDVPRFLELEAVRDTPYYELFYLILFTGMRRSEALALRWCDIDLLLCQVSVNRGLHQLKDGSYIFTEPKSAKSRRTIALPPSAALVLREYKGKQEATKAMLGGALRDDDLVFSKLDGKPLRPNTVTRAWKTLAARAGLKAIRLHDARHTHASIMLKQGIHPKIVQERLGHSSIQITLDTYSHVAPGLQEAAAARFDEGLAPRQKIEAEKEAVVKSG